VHKVVLACDLGKEAPPAFLYPFLTGRQQQALLADYEQIGTACSQMENLARAFAAAEKHLQGWENMGRAYEPGQLAEVCNVTEAMELVNRLLLQGPDASEKKR
jgi:hypothetical protein